MASEMPSETPAALARLAADLRRVFGDRFVALAARGPEASAVFATRIDAADLDAMSALAETWHHDGLALPLVMTPDELRRSLDAFPLEYQEMLDRYTLVDGVLPFAGVTIDPTDLRRACEVQAKSHLVHLRQGWLASHGKPEELERLAARSAPALRTLLTQMARLSGHPGGSTDDLAAFATRTTGLADDVTRALLTLDAHPDGAPVVAGRMADYLAAVERLCAFVDGWAPSSGR
jgi:hypothetical protein